MASEAQVEAAAQALDKTLPLNPGQRDLVVAARAALEAAERVREQELAHKIEDEEATERVRKVRAEFG
jgi:hypothetical protein